MTAQTKIKRTVPQAIFETKDALRAAALGHKQACDELARMNVNDLSTGNPNHPINDGIFGYATADLMAKQYEGSVS